MEFTHIQKLKNGKVSEIIADAIFVRHCDCCFPNKGHVQSVKVKSILVYDNEKDREDGVGGVEANASETEELYANELESNLDAAAYSEYEGESQ